MVTKYGSCPWVAWLAVVILSSACSPEPGVDSTPGAGKGKTDTAWISDSSFELGAVLESRVTRQASGAWAELATDRALQEQLVDTQVKFAKRAMMKADYEINQLVYRIRSLDVTTDGDRVTLGYSASVDLVKNEGPGVEPPPLEDLPQLEFDVPLPLDPVDVKARVGERCAADWEPYSLREDNYYYYFRPGKDGCDLELHTGKLTIEKVYPRRVVYPEYDRLLGALEGGGKGFRAAMLPTNEDSDTAAILARMKDMLELDLGLTATQVEGDDRFDRYLWTRDGATMVIDLYDPNKTWGFKKTYQEALGKYQLVHYAGHSEYGSKDLLSDATKFSKEYQVFMMWSCHSYAYYARRVFRAKATLEDPTGFAAADFVGTAPTPFFGDEARGIRELLEGLMDGIAAVSRGEDNQAPTWIEIIKKMNLTSWDRPYGAAGARTNEWQPAAP
jgi:hypothetical protein